MPIKTRRPPCRNPKTRKRNGHRDEGAIDIRTRSEDRFESGRLGESPARLRINLTRIGTRSRFWIIDANGTGVATSRLHASPRQAKAALIEFIKAIQADDFESFDYTGELPWWKRPAISPSELERGDRKVWDQLLAKRKTNPRWEMVFQEPASKSSPEWTPVVRGTMTKLSDGSLAYLFDAGPPLKADEQTH